MCTTCNQSQPTGDCPACSEVLIETIFKCDNCCKATPTLTLDDEGWKLCDDCIAIHEMQLQELLTLIF